MSLVPGGGAISELLNLVIIPAAAESQRRWLQGLDHDFSKLREKVEGFSFESLQQREVSFPPSSGPGGSQRHTPRGEAHGAAQCGPHVAIGVTPDDDVLALFYLDEGYIPWHLGSLHSWTILGAGGEEAKCGRGGILCSRQVMHERFPDLVASSFVMSECQHLMRDGLLRPDIGSHSALFTRPAPSYEGLVASPGSAFLNTGDAASVGDDGPARRLAVLSGNDSAAHARVD